MFPAVHFSYMQFMPFGEWGCGLAKVSEQLEALRKSLKDACGYRYDNDHFYLEDMYGRPLIRFNVTPDSAVFYDVTGTIFLFSFTKERWEKTPVACYERIQDALDALGEGKKLCYECGSWVEEGKQFGFTGFVCNDCYDPLKHRPPDMKGD